MSQRKAAGATASGCVRPLHRRQTLLTLDLPVEAGHGAGDFDARHRARLPIRIFDRDNSDFVVITDVDDKEKTFSWGAMDTPSSVATLPPPLTYVEVVEFEIHATLRDRREVFRQPR